MKTKQFRIGRLATLGQVIKALGKTIRAMSDGSLDSQVGARICNGLGIMRACLETQKLEQLEARMDEIADRVARDRRNVARERTSTHETQRPSQSHPVMHLQIVEVNAQLTGRYVASAPHSWTMRIGPAESRG